MISIITVCLNSSKTIRYTMESIVNQNTNDYEHIVIDGGSQDDTLSIISEYSRQNLRVISEKDNGIYDAINKGIALAKGDIIAILNSDDFYIDNNVLSDVTSNFSSNPNISCLISEVVFYRGPNLNKIVRFYGIKLFKPSLLRIGLMPPHPGSFFKKEIYTKYGLYNPSFKICGDFDFFVRVFLTHQNPFIKLRRVTVKMKQGGVSSSGLKSFVLITKEFNKSLKLNGYFSSLFLLLLRLPFKVFQKNYFSKT